MAELLKFILILIEWGVQLKRRDDAAQKQQRLHEARTDPANYLRKFGRVQRTESSKSGASVPGNGTSTDQHNGE